MSLAFRPDHFYLGLFFVSHNGAGPVADRVDWMGTAARPVAGGAWEVVCRFRRHNSPDPADLAGVDDAEWFAGAVDAAMAPEVMAARMRQIQQEIRKEFGGNSFTDVLWLRCTGDKVGERLRGSRKAWLHIREVNRG